MRSWIQMLEKNRLSVVRVITWMWVDDDCSGVYPLWLALDKELVISDTIETHYLDVLNRGWRVWGEKTLLEGENP